MDKNKSIGFFDSGVGGLTVLAKLKKILPNEDYIYFGDLKNSPYGEKSKEELIKIADKVFKFFEKQNVKAVVMACNTTSANVYEELKDKYNFKIYPIIQSCAGIISQMPVKKIGVFATDATIKSGVYERELKKHNKNLEVFQMSCPPWVGIVEEQRQTEPKSVACVASSLGEMLKNFPEKIILGCTHYPFLLNTLAKFAPKDMFIDPAEHFANHIKMDLEKEGMTNDLQQGSEKFYVSANADNFQKAASIFYHLDKTPEIIQL